MKANSAVRLLDSRPSFWMSLIIVAHRNLSLDYSHHSRRLKIKYNSCRHLNQSSISTSCGLYAPLEMIRVGWYSIVSPCWWGLRHGNISVAACWLEVIIWLSGYSQPSASIRLSFGIFISWNIGKYYFACHYNIDFINLVRLHLSTTPAIKS